MNPQYVTCKCGTRLKVSQELGMKASKANVRSVRRGRPLPSGLALGQSAQTLAGGHPGSSLKSVSPSQQFRHLFSMRNSRLSARNNVRIVAGTSRPWP